MADNPRGGHAALTSARRVLDRTTLANNSEVSNWLVSRFARADRPSEFQSLSPYTTSVVVDHNSGRTLFFLKDEDAAVYRQGGSLKGIKHFEVRGIPRPLRPDSKERRGMMHLGAIQPSSLPKSEKGRVIYDALQQAIEDGTSFSTRREFQEYLKQQGVDAQVSESDRERLWAAFQIRSMQDGSLGLDAGAVDDMFLSEKQKRRLRQDGRATMLGPYVGDIDEASRERARRELGVEWTGNKRDWLEQVAQAKGIGKKQAQGMSPRDLVEADSAADDVERRAANALYKASGKLDFTRLEDLTKIGVGDKSIMKFKRAGITVEHLASGQVGEDRIRELGGISEGKIKKMREAGLIIPPSLVEKRKPGRPPKLFGQAADPFRGNNNRGLFSRTVHARSPTTGAIEERRVEGSFGEKWLRFKRNLMGTIGRPYELVRQARDTEANRYVREAKAIAATKRAVGLRDRVAKSKTGLGATFWEVLFHGGNAVRRTLILAIVLGSVLFLPIGILHLAGWLTFGVVAFLINGAFLVGLTMINLLTSGAVNALNTFGILTNTFLQGFLDEVNKAFPTRGSGGSGVLPGYQPQDITWKVPEVLDPNLFFPDCVNTNTLGSAVLKLASTGLLAFSGWVAANPAFAVGVTVILLLGLPAYYVSKGTSIGFTLAGVGIMFVPLLKNGIDVPFWGAGIAVLLMVAALVALIYYAGREGGALTMAIGIGAALAVLAVISIGWQTFQAVTGPGDGFDVATTKINVSVQPLADALAGTTTHVAAAFDYVGDLVTTGWGHALSQERLASVRGLLTYGSEDAATLANASQACGGT